MALAGVIYMDHAATTRMDERVCRAMEPYCHEYYGNPATLYSLGRKSSVAVDRARGQLAELLGARPEEIYFTSGGTESDNWAVKGVAYASEKKGRHLITTKIEHHAVLESCHFLEKHGWEVTYLPVDGDGLMEPEDVRQALRDDTVLVSVMHANNEIGTMEPIAEIGRMLRERGVPFHTDAVQTVGKVAVQVDELNVDLLSLSAHKFYGPKGVGALYVRRGVRLDPFLHGGGQERGKRASTHNVPGIVGLGAAAELAAKEMGAEEVELRRLAWLLWEGLRERISGIRLNGHLDKRLPGNVNVCVEGAEGEAMLLCLDNNGVCVSSGSACTTGSLEPSHVLLAIGVPAEEAHGSLRFSLGKTSTVAEVEHVLEVLPGIVARLREMNPLYGRREGRGV
jgi:cysteine desulfurase